MVMVPGIFVAVLAIIVGSYYALVVRPEDEQQRKLRRRLKTTGPGEIARTALVKEISRLSSVGFVQALLSRASRLVLPIQHLIDQSGYRMTVGTFILATVCTAGIPMVAVTWVSGRLPLGIAVGACTAFLPLG